MEIKAPSCNYNIITLEGNESSFNRKYKKIQF